VELKWGWGWNRFVDGARQLLQFEEVYSVGKMTVTIHTFFKCDGRLRGFTGILHGQGHKLDGLEAVFFTMSDGEDFDFTDNICMVWRAMFGDQEPSGSPGHIPDFTSGEVYTGYATVFEDEGHLQRCQDRLNSIDPRHGSSG
jgi:hypothetical protein